MVVAYAEPPSILCSLLDLLFSVLLVLKLIVIDRVALDIVLM